MYSKCNDYIDSSFPCPMFPVVHGCLFIAMFVVFFSQRGREPCTAVAPPTRTECAGAEPVSHQSGSLQGREGSEATCV